MAKDKTVVFSSERLESRERLKRILILIAVLLVIVALVVAAAFIKQRFVAEVFTGGEDTSYPYSWSNKDGIVTVDIARGADPGCSWTYISTDPLNYPSAVPEKQPKGKDRFTFTPAGEGRHNAIFVLVNENNEGAGIMEMLMETTADSRGVLQTEILSSSLSFRQVEKHGGEGSYYPYSYRSDENGLLTVTVSGAAVVSDWECAVSPDEGAASLAGLFYEDNNLICFLSPGELPGDSTARISSAEGEVSIILDMKLQDSGDFLVTSDRMEGGTTPPPQPEEDETETDEISSEDVTDEPSQEVL